MNIYIVEGSTRRYGDYYEWNVKAFFSKEKAEMHAKNADLRAKELNQKYSSYDIPEGANEFDPRMCADGGVHYKVRPVELGDEA